MRTRDRILRAGLGILIVAAVVLAGLALVTPLISVWGATPNEITRVVPGDELIQTPTVIWTHGITINAPVEQVWGWIAQIGEQRGGFYSYTFIENRMGNGEVYHNAAQIVPEWQNPPLGTVLIAGAPPMRVYQVEPGKQFIGLMDGDMKWVWGWYLEPIGQNQTRLMVRMKIQTPPGLENPIVGSVINLGGFVMEQGMLQGIQARAEGNVPPPYSELLEIVLWLGAFAAGVTAAVLFVACRAWMLPFLFGMLSIFVLFVITFWQPPLWTRALANMLLWAGLVWFVYQTRRARSLPRPDLKTLTLKPTA